jgi:carboxypeptidase Q
MLILVFRFILGLSVLEIILSSLSLAQTEKSSKMENYEKISKKIIEAALNDSVGWERLAYMCDTYGSRLAGSENLNNAIKWAYSEMKKIGFENVKLEEVMVPHWVRGNEFCEMTLPRKQKLEMIGLGGSIATPKEGITAPVIVFHDFDELEKNSKDVKGKIVLFNERFKNYGQAVQYRVSGASRAARYGAVACLIRSVTPIAMNIPHTGVMGYEDSIPKIPAAALSPEDASLIERIHDRGQNVVLHLYMEAETLPDTLSYNLMGELRGKTNPEEIIAFGGHSDSWDVGSGAQDDASGVITSLEALRILKELGIQPNKTLRCVFWVNEENGTRGGINYAERHGKEKHSLVFEFDSGVFPPEGIRYKGPDSIFNDFKKFEPLFQDIDSIKILKGGGGTDIGPMMRLGIPAMSLNTSDKGKYFWYHHSKTDTPDKVDPLDFRKCIATIALSMFLYSEMP